MIQSQGAAGNMRAARWLTVPPRFQNNGHASHLGSFHTKSEKRDTTLPRHNNGYLYAEKNRPRPIWLPFQHDDYPIRMQEFDADDDWDITDIDRIKNETPMHVIQRYNGFFQGIRNNRLGSITEEDDETVDADKGQRSKDNRDDDDDDQTEFDRKAGRFWSERVSEHRILTSTNFQRRVRTTFQPKQRFAKNAYDKWPQSYPMDIRGADNFLLNQPASSARETNESIQNKPNMASEEYLQTLSDDSETCDSDELLSKRSIELQKNFHLIPSKTNGNSFGDRLLPFQHLCNDVYSVGIKSLDLNKNSTNATRQISKDKKDVPLKSLLNNQTGNEKAVYMNDKNVISGFDLTGDDFYRTFLPLSLAENESVTKINPIAVLSASEEEIKENSSEKNENGFVYSVEDFPHPPDYFFDLDSDPISSVSLLTDNYKQDIKETKACCGQLRTTQRHICETGGHMTFLLTNQTSEESVESSSDCFSASTRQSSHESDFISESVSNEFIFETNPNKEQVTLNPNGCPDSKNKEKDFVFHPRYVSMQTSSHDATSCTRRLALIPDNGLESKNNELTESNSDIETRHDAERIGLKQMSDTTLRSYLNTKKTCRSITSEMESQNNTRSQCYSNSQKDSPARKPNVFDVISTKNCRHALQKKTQGTRTHGHYLRNESSNQESEYTESRSFVCKNSSSGSLIHLDHFQEGDQRSKDRLTAIQNMLERAITIDGVCYTTKDNFCRSPIAESVRGRQT